MLISLVPHPLDFYPEGTTYDDIRADKDAVQHVTVWPSASIKSIRLPEIVCRKEYVNVVGNHRAKPCAEPLQVPVMQVTYGITELPRFAPGIYYVVSRVVADMIRRKDFVYPYELIRDEQNKVVGCTKLGRMV